MGTVGFWEGITLAPFLEQDQKSIDAIKAIVYFNNLNIQEI